MGTIPFPMQISFPQDPKPSFQFSTDIFLEEVRLAAFSQGSWIPLTAQRRNLWIQMHLIPQTSLVEARGPQRGAQDC